MFQLVKEFLKFSPIIFSGISKKLYTFKKYNVMLDICIRCEMITIKLTHRSVTSCRSFLCKITLGKFQIYNTGLTILNHAVHSLQRT